eukprot:Clim_evm87s88 gene=Clim_evmTU87s88
MPKITKLLVANRGEIALRIIRAAQELGIRTIAVYGKEDSQSPHRYEATQSFELPTPPPPPGQTMPHPSSAYLNLQGIMSIVKQAGADALHPGYGFLSEDPKLAQACLDAGVVFIGPEARTLSMLGDKLQAKAVAQTLGIPVPWASGQSARTFPELQSIVQEASGVVSYPFLLKAVNGGGGKGIGVVESSDALEPVFQKCSAEGVASSGDPSVFVEQYIARAKHVEVQVLADQTGDVIHLWDRDCSLQLQRQKFLEFAPADGVPLKIREKLWESAIAIARAADYRSAGTVEFLVDVTSGEYYFLEVNPRVQVEHTVTEEFSGVDIVQNQLLIGQGATLRELGLHDVKTPDRGTMAVQARINMESHTESLGINRLHYPLRPFTRIDSGVVLGQEVPPFYDRLLLKVICRGSTRADGLQRMAAALRELHVGPISTNRDMILAVLQDPTVVQDTVTTTDGERIYEHFDRSIRPQLAPRQPEAPGEALSQRRAVLTNDGRLTLLEEIVGGSDPSALQDQGAAADGALAVRAPMSGMLSQLNVKKGESVSRSTVVGNINVMKMEHSIRAMEEGRVASVVISAGSLVKKGEPILILEPDTSASQANKRLQVLYDHIKESYEHPEIAPSADNLWKDAIDELHRRRARALEMGGEKGLQRQHSAGKLDPRSRIALLLDKGSFYEIGSIAGKTVYANMGRDEIESHPANYIGGQGRIHGREVMVGADDFTIRGGHADGAIWLKQVQMEKLALDFRIPMVRLLDGSSGGGSVTTMLDAGYSYAPPLVGWRAQVDILNVAPVCGLLLGPVVGLGAARAMMTHFSVMVRGLSQLFVAGPPVVEYATHQSLTKEQLGGWSISGTNGSVDQVVESEEEAFKHVRKFLSYLPTNAYELAPRNLADAQKDDPKRTDDGLASIVPKTRGSPFDMRKIIDSVVDRESFFEIGKEWGSSMIVGLARLDGYSVGVLAQNPEHLGGALDSNAARKVRRHVDLCQTFHLPILNLVDQPGFAVGLEAEVSGVIREGATTMASLYTATVPFFTTIVRRAFGVAGAAFIDRGDPNYRVAWPSGDWGSLPLEGGIEAAYKAKLKAAEDPKAVKDALLEQFEPVRNPLRAAAAFNVEEVIDPRYTRPLACRWVHLAYRKLNEPHTLQPQMCYRP